MARTTDHFGFIRTKKIFFALVTLLATIMLFVPITGTYAYAMDTDTKDLNTALLPYAQELEKINFELGTDYIFVPNDELSEVEYNELVDFYQQMTLEEFRDYIFKAYENDISYQNNCSEFEFNYCTTSENLHNNGDTQIFSLNPVSTITQKYFYKSSSKNYLAITADVMYGDGRGHYLDNDVTFESHIADYPGYRIEKGTYNFSMDQSEIYVKFTCKRFTAVGVQNAITYTIPVTFNSDGFDVYPTDSI